MTDVIRYDGTDHTARAIGTHHNAAGMWETSVLPGHPLSREDADYVISILARTASRGQQGLPFELARPSVLDLARRNGIALDHLSANLDGRPGTFYIASDRPDGRATVYTWHLQYDIYDDGRPAYVVGWEIWTGGWREVRRWAWDVSGLAQAGIWAVEHRAVNRHGGYAPRTPDELLSHAEPAAIWPIERAHQPSAPIVACDTGMQLTYQVDCSCGKFSSGWRFTEQLARREITEHRSTHLDLVRDDVRTAVDAARQQLALRYPVQV